MDPANRPPAAPSGSIPELCYQPPDPITYRPGIGLIGCGGITIEHLTAYRAAGYRVVALCDVIEDRAYERRAFYPEADVYRDAAQLLTRPDIDVVDIAVHPEARPPLVEAALRAGKHVLSQKPFVLDLDEGRKLADLADQAGVLLAVNQNARWAPHFGYLRAAAAAGLLGHIASIQFSAYWDHNWVMDTPFDKIPHLILYDYAIHWFDLVACLMRGRTALRVEASVTRSHAQRATPPLIARAVIQYENMQAVLAFNGDTRFGPYHASIVVGDSGTVQSIGPDENRQQLTLFTAQGAARPTLRGRWFPDGFHGAMGELLCAIEEDRQPEHNARDNLSSLALCFAAVASAERNEPVVPGAVRRLL